MPVHKINRSLDLGVLDLRRQLELEWRNPRSSRTAEPVIFESESAPDGPIELYVVWSRWKGVGQNTRSEIILDAFEAVHGAERAMAVTLAIGLTPEEAEEEGFDADALAPE